VSTKSGRIRVSVAFILIVAAAGVTVSAMFRSLRAESTPPRSKELLSPRGSYLRERLGLASGDAQGAYERAVAQARAMNAIIGHQANAVTFKWEAIGPEPIKNELSNYAGLTQDTPGTKFDAGGRVTALAIDPSGNIYVGTGGGVWMSIDKGATFRVISDALPIQSIGSIAVYSVNTTPPTVYVGTGEDNGGNTYYGRGLYRTQDFGAHWDPVPPAVPFPTPTPGVFNENSSALQAFTTMDARCGNLFAGSGGGVSTSRGAANLREPGGGGYVFQSINGGSTWHRTFQNPANKPNFVGAAVRSLSFGVTTVRGSEEPAMFAAMDRQAIFLAPGACETGLALWQQSIIPKAPVGRSSVAGNTTDPTAFAMIGAPLAGAPDGNVFLFFLRTIDGGATWPDARNVPCASTTNGGVTWSTDRTLCGNLGRTTIDGTNGRNFAHAFYSNVLLMTRSLPHDVYFGGVGLYRSMDEGMTWRFLPGLNGTGSARIHADQHALVFDNSHAAPGYSAPH
jgi:hypothetical protein